MLQVINVNVARGEFFGSLLKIRAAEFLDILIDKRYFLLRYILFYTQFQEAIW